MFDCKEDVKNGKKINFVSLLTIRQKKYDKTMIMIVFRNTFNFTPQTTI